MVCQLIQDHPRRCGENKEAQAIKVLCTGSPPQVRGKPAVGIDSIYTLRITPAGAGKTLYSFLSKNRSWDHPRRCGENLFRSFEFGQAPGSPPQVRGKPNKFKNLYPNPRITPAGAGKTQCTYGWHEGD